MQSVNTDNISISFDGVEIKPGELIYTDAGSQMVEQHFRTVHNDLLVLFYIRQYKDGERHTTIVVENGYLNLVTPQKDYTAVVKIGDHSETHEISHYRSTAWVAEHREGQFASVRQTTESLIASGMTPNYPISPDSPPGSYQDYKPGETGNHTVFMGDPGYQYQIGLLPGWDAAYLANTSDAAYDSVIANAKAILSYPLVWRDADTYRTIDLEKFRRWMTPGPDTGGVNQECRGDVCWERAHFPSTGYLAYLLTGEQQYLDVLAHTAALCYLVQSYGYGGGFGVDRVDGGQTRGQAWCYRAAGMYAAVTDAKDLGVRFDNNISKDAQNVGINELGISYDPVLNLYGPGTTSPWMNNFRVAVLGFLSDIEPLEDMSDLIALRDFNYKFPVGLLKDKWCKAGGYTLKIAPDDAQSIAELYTWNEVNAERDTCGTTIDRSISTSYWANLLPAISYAIKHGSPGARDAWTRLKTVGNFNQWMYSFRETAVWGVVFE